MNDSITMFNIIPQKFFNVILKTVLSNKRNSFGIMKESYMSKCNFCTMKNIKKLAKDQNLTVSTKNDEEYALGGINVFVHKPEEKIDKDLHFKAWFMELPERCCC